MKQINQILETKDVVKFLQSRNLLSQYKKAKLYLLQERVLTVRFRGRKPNGSGIWYFRINKQYRAYCTFSGIGNLVVFEINDHQNK